MTIMDDVYRAQILFISDIPDAFTVYPGYQIKPLGIIDILDTNILYRACYQAYMFVSLMVLLIKFDLA